ncbi:MAG: hypothetical protein NT049_04495, partial [Planctomycetota bacterium]|nr:hypothetical protein [Planctomycetota bacterium]
VQIQSNGILLQGQNGNMAPGTVTGSAVFIVGEGGDSGSGTFVQEGAGSTVHVIQGANGAVGTITIRVEQSDK